MIHRESGCNTNVYTVCISAYTIYIGAHTHKETHGDTHIGTQTHTEAQRGREMDTDRHTNGH